MQDAVCRVGNVSRGVPEVAAGVEERRLALGGVRQGEVVGAFGDVGAVGWGAVGLFVHAAAHLMTLVVARHWHAL